MIRHGQIRSNVEDVYAGRTDEELTESGASQANRLGQEIRDLEISVIYTSPLARTVQTAEIMNAHLRARLIKECDLLEMDLGPWTGLSKAEVAGKYPEAYRTWVEAPAEFRFEGMETLQGIQERAICVLDKFLKEAPDMIGAIVTHAVIIKCAFLYFNHLPLNAYHKIDVPNLSVHKATFRDGRSRMERIR